MGSTTSPRYEAYTTTRFYPSMVGRNLTFAPSQYADAAPSGAVQGTSGTGGAGSVWMSLAKLGGAIVGEVVEYKTVEGAKDREAARERESKLFEAKIETERAKAQMISGSLKPVEEPSVWPWVIGGTVLLGGIAFGVTKLLKD